MIPGNRLSSRVVAAAYLSPDDREPGFLEDWEFGGIALNDPSQGLRVQIWRAWVEEGQNLYVGPENGVGTLILVRPKTTFISLAFDNNMRPILAYMQDGRAKLYWYDSAIEEFTDTDFGGVVYPRLSLDVKTRLYIQFNDVLFVYISNRDLVFRQQRDRFQVEYLLQADAGEGIIQVGMTRNNRIKFTVMKRTI